MPIPTQPEPGDDPTGPASGPAGSPGESDAPRPRPTGDADGAWPLDGDSDVDPGAGSEPWEPHREACSTTLRVVRSDLRVALSRCEAEPADSLRVGEVTVPSGPRVSEKETVVQVTGSLELAWSSVRRASHPADQGPAQDVLAALLQSLQSLPRY